MRSRQYAGAPVRTLALVVAFVVVLVVDWTALRDLLKGDADAADTAGFVVLTAALVITMVLIARRLRRRAAPRGGRDGE